MVKHLVVVGCGGFGRETHDVVDAITSAFGESIELLGFVDDAPSSESVSLVQERGSRVLGPLSWFDAASTTDISYVIAIGNPQARRHIDAVLSARGFTASVLVHPQATIGWKVQLAPGTIVCAGARITTNITLGRHVHVDRNCLVGHDSDLGDYVSQYPGASVAGNTRIGEGTLLGASSTVLQGLVVGADVTVGAGGVITRNVPDGVTAVGVPARWS